MIRKLIPYVFIIPAICISMNSFVVHANAIPANLKEILDKHQRHDIDIVKKQQLKILVDYYDKKYESIITGFENRDDILNELDWVRVMYGNPPLDALKRIQVRQVLTSLIEKHDYSDQEYNFLMSLLVHYGCIKEIC